MLTKIRTCRIPPHFLVKRPHIRPYQPPWPPHNGNILAPFSFLYWKDKFYETKFLLCSRPGFSFLFLHASRIITSNIGLTMYAKYPAFFRSVGLVGLTWAGLERAVWACARMVLLQRTQIPVADFNIKI